MRSFQLNAAVHAPPGEVFDLLADPGRLPAWDPAVVHVRVPPGEPLAAGSRLRLSRAVGARTRVGELRVEALEPGRRLVLVEVVGGVERGAEYRVDAEGDGTRVSLRLWLRAVGWRRLFEGRLFGRLCDDESDRLVRLKRVVEGVDLAYRHNPPDPLGDA